MIPAALYVWDNLGLKKVWGWVLSAIVFLIVLRWVRVTGETHGREKAEAKSEKQTQATITAIEDKSDAMVSQAERIRSHVAVVPAPAGVSEPGARLPDYNYRD